MALYQSRWDIDQSPKPGRTIEKLFKNKFKLTARTPHSTTLHIASMTEAPEKQLLHENFFFSKLAAAADGCHW
jgi:hypothetical protein